MGQATNFLIVILLGLFAILSLYVAGGGNHNFQYWTGIGFFVICVLLCFYAVHHLTSSHGKQDSGH